MGGQPEIPSDKDSSQQHPCCHKVSLVQGYMEKALKQGFYKYGVLVAQYPWLFILIPLGIVILMSPSMSNMQIQVNIRREFAPIGSQANYEFEVAKEFFQGTRKPFWVMIAIEAKDGGSLMRPEYLDEVIRWKNYYQDEFSVEVNGRNWSWYDFCDPHCIEMEPANKFLNLYKLNSTAMDYKYPASSIFIRGRRRDSPLYIANNIYGVQVNPDTNQVESFTILVMHLRATITNDTEQEICSKWEKAMYEKSFEDEESDLIRSTVGSHSMISWEVSRNVDESNYLLLVSIIVLFAFTFLTTFQFSWRKAKPLEAVCIVCTPLLAIIAGFSLVFMVGYEYTLTAATSFFAILAIGVDDGFLMLHSWQKTNRKLPNVERMGEMMAHAGPSITITSLTNALAFGIGISANTISIRYFSVFACTACCMDYILQVTFFAAIVALGGRREEKQLPPSCCCCFSCCCIISKPSTDSNLPASTSNNMSKLAFKASGELQTVLRRLSDVLVTVPARLIVAAFLVCYWTIAGIGLSRLEIALSDDKLYSYDSPLTRLVQINRDIVGKESIVGTFIVNRPGDLRNLTRLRRLERMIADFEQLKGHVGRVSSNVFLTDFKPFLQQENEILHENLTVFCHYQLQDFIVLGNNARWKSYLRLNEDKCSTGMLDDYDDSFVEWTNDELSPKDSSTRGLTIQKTRRKRANKNHHRDSWKDYEDYSTEEYDADADNDYYFKCDGADSGCLEAFYFTTSFRAANWAERSQVLLAWRDLCQKYTDFNVTAFDELNYYTDQYLSIGSMTVQTVGIAIACMAVICLLFIPDFTSVFCALMSMLSIIYGVFGFLVLWGVDLDPISVSTTLMSIGFSVDYTSHVSYHFFRNKNGQDRRDRLWSVLSAVGWPTILAGTSTILTGFIASLRYTYLYQVFYKTVVLIVIFGLLHALVILPVILTTLPLGTTNSTSTKNNWHFQSNSNKASQSSVTS